LILQRDERIAELERSLAFAKSINAELQADWEVRERELSALREQLANMRAQLAAAEAKLAKAEPVAPEVRAMTDTPNTDAAVYYPDDGTGACVDADFARKLERERDALLAVLISALGVGYDENGWQDLARAAILARAARGETI
jgi:septal ring factor EnvC (AmiA/AmiB activator)